MVVLYESCTCSDRWCQFSLLVMCPIQKKSENMMDVPKFLSKAQDARRPLAISFKISLKPRNGTKMDIFGNEV